MSVAARQFISIEEYLDADDRSEVRYEYVRGVMYAMTGGRISHNRAAVRLSWLVRDAAVNDGCDVFVSDARLRIGDHLSYYPGVMVCCEDADDDDRFRTSPCLVAEVLSPSTADVDRREKLSAYLAIPSLTSYLLIDPESRTVEAHVRQSASDQWRHETYGVDGTILLRCPPADVNVADLFA